MPCWSHADDRICVSLAYYLPKPNRMCPLKVMIVHFEMLLVYFSCYKIMISFAFRNLITSISSFQKYFVVFCVHVMVQSFRQGNA